LTNFTKWYLLPTYRAFTPQSRNEARTHVKESFGPEKTDEISVPVAITVFPDEVFRAQET
jgi:hypothetical protein